MPYSGGIAIQVVKVAVQRITVKLNGDDLLCCGIGDSERFLQTLKHPFAVLMRELTTSGLALGTAIFLSTCRFDVGANFFLFSSIRGGRFFRFYIHRGSFLPPHMAREAHCCGLMGLL